MIDSPKAPQDKEAIKGRELYVYIYIYIERERDIDIHMYENIIIMSMFKIVIKRKGKRYNYH